MEEINCYLPVSKPSSEACPTEDAIRALLENLVDPLLPPKPSTTDVPSKVVCESVAKQVHAVVLLYNYYHRREHPHLECLSFESFRSLATVMRPALMPHFEEGGVLEKVIVDACSLSMSLDASVDFSSLKKWPIRKVAVLLVDSKKSCCYLQHSSITQGVWSLVEKAFEREETSAAGGQSEEAICQKVAFAAIEEATGINHKDIVILERHLVQSLSEEKTTAQFYIMKCTSEDKFCGEFPVDDTLNCMQGPLFEKSFSEWSTNSIVEYFHVLPYATLIADWFSRREDAEFVIEKEAEAVRDEINSYGKADESDICPTEDAIRALLENLVDPLLPLKPSPTDVLSKALRESVAKQVRAVVLLYNYYHRRDHPHLESLSFESFCSLTTVMRPALLPHFKESGEALLEKVIMDACSLSMSLGVCSDFSSLKKWHTRKVAVLLVDSKKTCCYLQYSSITQGVWSLLEKTIEREKTSAAEGQNEEAIFQKVAFAAIKEATGINHKDIVILERHLVHSLSEEKTTAKFYIMKCTSEDKFCGEFPVEEALNCMQGPLFEKSFSEWSTNSIVEYFHVLPYASLITSWFSRRGDAEFVIEKEAEAVCDEIESNGKADELDICPTEDAIRALLENLVDPLLPHKPSPSDVPSKAVRESVAKQVHAVVLLYNYYHRRDHPHLECLSFESFRSLTTVMRPALLPHFQESGEALLQKVIVDACSLSKSLHVCSDFSSLRKWPIKKVAVLLVDSKKTCCYLQHSSITQGVWSLLEKTIEIEKTAAALGQNEEAIFQKVVFAAIKEATGINHKDVVILERHLVHSLSEEKTTAKFYMMKCTSEDKFPGEFPVEEALNCMQGPLFEKSFSVSEWSTSFIVEYFHVLPYASLITDWFSRREDTEFVIEKEAEAVCDEIESNGKADESDNFNTPGRGDNATSKRSNDTNARKDAAPRSSPKARKKVAPKTFTRNLRGRTIPAVEPSSSQVDTVIALKAKKADNEMSPCKESYSNGERGGMEVGCGSNYQRERDNQRKKAVTDKLKSILKLNNPSPVSVHDSNINLEELQTTLLSKATSLSETALKVLYCKRDRLTLQQRDIEDEIAECDKRIKRIKGNCELQLETILESCNEAYSRRIIQETHDKSACQSNKRVKLSEPTKSMCQKLDDLCLENNWVLPNYRVSSTDGGYEAEVRIKETHFAHTICGEEKSDAEEARESAAACLLSRLHHNTRQQPSTSRS